VKRQIKLVANPLINSSSKQRLMRLPAGHVNCSLSSTFDPYEILCHQAPDSILIWGVSVGVFVDEISI
jgi:hypothetical protein